MSGADSNAARLRTERRRAENPGEKFSPHRRTPRRPLPAVHAWGVGYLVTARTGRTSVVVIVTRCPSSTGCLDAHRFTVRPDVDLAVRCLPCDPGTRFALHVLMPATAVAS